MHNHIDLLVKDNNVIVLINYIKGNVLGYNLLARKLRKGKFNLVTATQLKTGLDNLAVDLDSTGFNCLLNHNSAVIAESTVEVFINPALLD
jgi:hypothetical protein